MIRKLITAVVMVVLAPLVPPASGARPIDYLNAQRHYFRMSPLQLDHTLQAEAQRRANEMASLQRMGNRVRVRGRSTMQHLPGRLSGTGEGIGMRTGRYPDGKHFFSCTQNTKQNRVGAACAVGRNNVTYYSLIMR